MAKSAVASGVVTVTIADTEYQLEPTIPRCMEICDLFDGPLPLYRSLANANFMTAAQIILVGSGTKLDKDEFPAFAMEVRDEGTASGLYDDLTRFAITVFRGGKSEDTGDKTEDGSGGKD